MSLTTSSTTTTLLAQNDQNSTQGGVLRNIEQEWNTLMFFAKSNRQEKGGPEKLCIFGSRRARRGAELKVMSGIEHKISGHFLEGQATDVRLKAPLNQHGDDINDPAITRISIKNNTPQSSQKQ